MIAIPLPCNYKRIYAYIYTFITVCFCLREPSAAMQVPGLLWFFSKKGWEQRQKRKHLIFFRVVSGGLFFFFFFFNLIKSHPYRVNLSSNYRLSFRKRTVYLNIFWKMTASFMCVLNYFHFASWRGWNNKEWNAKNEVHFTYYVNLCYSQCKSNVFHQQETFQFTWGGADIRILVRALSMIELLGKILPEPKDLILDQLELWLSTN